MNKVIVPATAAALSLFDIAAAMGADLLPVGGPLPVDAAPVPAWTGFYIGVHGGVRAEFSDVSGALPVGNPFAAQLDPLTGLGGGHAGYNLQILPLTLIGLEGSTSWGRSKKSASFVRLQVFDGVTFSNGGAISVDHDWDATFRARAGFLVTSTTLLYAAGGVSFLNEKITENADIALGGGWSQTNTRVGWTLGGGVESLLTEHWLVRAEYLYADYGAHNYSGGAIPVSLQISTQTHTGRAGLTYKF